MYHIVGADGKTYGPVTQDQLRGWIAEQRANAQTYVLVDGAWKPLGTLPEFVDLAGPIRPVGHVSQPLTNPLATAGMIFGILSVTLLCCCYGFPFNLLGLIFSLLGLMRTHRHPDRCPGRGRAIAGLVLSIVSLVIMIALILIAVIMNPPDFHWNIQTS